MAAQQKTVDLGTAHISSAVDDLVKRVTSEATKGDQIKFEAQESLKRARRAQHESISRLAADLGPRYSQTRCSLDTYVVYDAKQNAPLKRIREISGELEQMVADGSGIVLYGGMGTGKDHLAAALLYQVAQFTTARWVNGREVFSQSRDMIKAERPERELIDELISPAVLCISDPVPVQGPQSTWNVDLLYRVLNGRYHQMRSTWMTLNAQSPKDAMQMLGWPVWDRLRHDAELIFCSWPSYREERSR